MTADNSLSWTHLIIPVLGMLVPIVAIVAHHLGKAYSERQRHLTIREFARAGQPVPPELLLDSAGAEATGSARGQRVLLPAFANAGLGLGLMGLFAVVSPDSWLWSIGLVPLALGFALALFALVERRLRTGP
ncbi:MAG TPA: DUF6249 domain-containing protein [Rubrivivax sp.]|nr:DUF6249 domain-containing protein [Rubrivivax sp.]